MDMTLSQLLTVGGVTAVVLVLIQAIKGRLPDDWEALIAIGLGIVLAVLASLAQGNYSVAAMAQAALTGLLGGAAAVGAYKAQVPAGILPSKPDKA